MVWRRRNLILGVMILCTLFGLSLLAFGSQIYTVRAYFYPRASQAAFISDIQKIDVAEELPGLIDRLSLMDRPEFNKALPDDKSVYSRFAQHVEYLMQQTEGRVGVARSDALAKLAQHVTIEISAGGQTVAIAARSTDFDTAVDVANGLQNVLQQKLAQSYQFVSHIDPGMPDDFVLVQPGKITYIPTPPDQMPVALLSAVIGFFIALGVAKAADRIQKNE